MPRALPDRPSLEYLKKEAKDLLKAGSASRLTEAQRLVAREYGFASWAKLKAYVESFAEDPREALAAAVRSSDSAALSRVLDRHPGIGALINDALPNAGFGETAIGVVAERGDREAIDLLLRAGADINVKSHWWAGGFGVLDVAPPEIVPFLLERGATMTAHAAARLGRMADLERLVATDPPVVHARGGDGQTPLHFASTVEVARFLLEHGADIDARCVDHESTPAMWMVRDRQDVARFLVSQGCDTDILMCAALGDLVRVREHLAADPNVIHMTVSDRYFPRRDPRAASTIYVWTLGAYKTPHRIAHEFGHKHIFEFLMSLAPAPLRLTVAGEIGDAALVDRILHDHPDVAANLSEDDRRQVARAAEMNDMSAVRTLLRAGWPVDALTKPKGATALHWAAFHGNVEMAKEILRYGPPLDLAEEGFGGTPLSWALYGSLHGYAKSPDYLGAVQLLVGVGASIPAFDRANVREDIVDWLGKR